MNDCAVVLNAGSSSLKFCVFERPAAETWKLAARGQIEGIGTSPHIRVKDGEGSVVADEPLGATVRDASTALDSLAAWFRGRFGNARLAASVIASCMEAPSLPAPSS